MHSSEELMYKKNSLLVPAMEWHPIQGVFLPHNTNQDKAVTQNE